MDSSLLGKKNPYELSQVLLGGDRHKAPKDNKQIGVIPVYHNRNKRSGILFSWSDGEGRGINWECCGINVVVVDTTGMDNVLFAPVFFITKYYHSW